MEQVERRLSFSGLTIDSDPSFRMQTRPSGKGIAPGAGKYREDFGSSGFTLSPRKSKINETRPASTQSTAILVDSSEDDGDIDLFSSPPGSSRHRKVRIRTTTASSSKEIEGPTGVMLNGGVVKYHPDYLPKSKLPKFKKNKSTNQTGDATDDTSSRAHTPHQLQESNPPSRNSPPILKQAQRKADKKAPPTPPRSSRPSPSPSPEIGPKRRIPRPTAKPPKRILKRVYSSDDSNDPLGGCAEEKVAIPPTKTERPKAKMIPPPKLTQQKFPLLNDPSFHSDQPLRVVSNLSPTRSRGSSLDASPVHSHDAKGKGRVLAISEDETEDRSGHAPQPFPLSTTFMDSTPKASKRHPEDESHSGGSERKRLKESLSNGMVLDGLPGSIGSQNPDFLFLDPNVDPSTLCPWCDQQLPADPTPRLKSLIESVRSKSYTSPRPSNPLGLGAPLTASVVVCQRHRFESHQIPKAQAKGWPTKIDFGKVKPRIEALRSQLEALLLNQSPDMGDSILSDEEDGKPRGACPFWTETMKEVKSKGTRTVASSKGQFASFKALQPGYYGELGYLIIHQTVYQLFPPDTVDPESTTPLNPSDFIQRVLVPEAAVHLIMEDMQSNYSSAIKTLRESVEYGVAMFPDAGGDNEEGVKAADDVVKERARVRRKELLEEEIGVRECYSSEMEVELELSRPSSPLKLVVPKKTRSKRGNAGDGMVTCTSESEQEVVMIEEPQIFTQRLPTAKSRKPTSGYRSDVSNASDASVASRMSTRSMTRKQTPKFDVRATPPSDPQPLPPSQPPRRLASGSSYRAKTPSDGSSDVELLSDRGARSTRSSTRGGPKHVPQPPSKNSGGKNNESKEPAQRTPTPDTDPDDELLNSSPFNVRTYVSRKTLSIELEDLDVDETPKVQKMGSMKLNPDPWGVSTTPTRQLNRPRSHDPQDFSHLVADDD